tara:strand:+ start:357 stop:809 length:453 start_codon:yes stop_codon:yes gene_type:complete
MSFANFEAVGIDWQPLLGADGILTDHYEMPIVNFDDDTKTIDGLFKFTANRKVCRYGYTSNYNTFVFKGEQCIDETDDSLKKMGPIDTNKAGALNARPHEEGGVDGDVLILFSLQPYSTTKLICQILEDDYQIASVMTFDDLKAIYQRVN